jgi:hypothetical protein
VEKYCGVVQATYDNMAHAHLKLGNQGYRYALRIRNAHCSNTATASDIIIATVQIFLLLLMHITIAR